MDRIAGDAPGVLDTLASWSDAVVVNRIFDLLVNQTFSVMANDALTAVPLFLFMGYIVERSNIIGRLFATLNIATRHVPGSMAVAALITCALRSEEHTSELQSLMRISYAVICLKKKKRQLSITT